MGEGFCELNALPVFCSAWALQARVRGVLGDSGGNYFFLAGFAQIGRKVSRASQNQHTAGEAGRDGVPRLTSVNACRDISILYSHDVLAVAALGDTSTE